MILHTAPELEDLPAPPGGKVGWPWTTPSNALPSQIIDNTRLPKISIVTPSYNYGHFLEEAIRSVLLQGYPNLEYIVIDGGSTDNSVEIIKKYENFLTYWVSEPDRGQTNALNKGYQKCTGDLFSWINSDDTYSPSTLWQVAAMYKKSYEMIAGSCRNIYQESDTEEIIRSPKWSFEKYLRFWSYPSNTFYPQPSVFLSKEIADKCFPLDESLYCAMDHQYFLRALAQIPKRIEIDKVWVNFTYHGNNKTGSTYPVFDELCEISLSESEKLPPTSRAIYQAHLKDYIRLRPLLYQGSISMCELLSLVKESPTILLLPLYWKVLIKQILNASIYFRLKDVKTKLFG